MNHNIKPEIAQKLCALLPTLQQCKWRLRKGDCFCFEGALCELYRRETGRGNWCGHAFDLDGRMNSTSLPPAVKAWATKDADTARFYGATASIVNDEDGWSFAAFVKELEAP